MWLPLTIHLQNLASVMMKKACLTADITSHSCSPNRNPTGAALRTLSRRMVVFVPRSLLQRFRDFIICCSVSSGKGNVHILNFCPQLDFFWHTVSVTDRNYTQVMQCWSPGSSAACCKFRHYDPSWCLFQRWGNLCSYLAAACIGFCIFSYCGNAAFVMWGRFCIAAV